MYCWLKALKWQIPAKYIPSSMCVKAVSYDLLYIFIWGTTCSQPQWPIYFYDDGWNIPISLYHHNWIGSSDYLGFGQIFMAYIACFTISLLYQNNQGDRSVNHTIRHNFCWESDTPATICHKYNGIHVCATWGPGHRHSLSQCKEWKINDINSKLCDMITGSFPNINSGLA